MSDPVSGTTVAAGGLMGASMFGLATGIDYGVVFGAFAGAVFYVATAVNITRLKLVGYFITSFIFGVLGAPLVGSFFSKWTNYSDRPLDALGAVMVAAVAIKLLTFVHNQDLGNGSLPQSILARGQRFDGAREVMTYTAAVSHAIVLEFYGDSAYTNAQAFLMLSKSQRANELRRTNALTIMGVSNITNVGQLLGQSHGNRVHLSFNVQYSPAHDVQTLRIDTPQFQFFED